MGTDEAALLRLWREKRGEVGPTDLSGNLTVQLGLVTEELNRRWYEANTSNVITDIQQQVRHHGPVDGRYPRRPRRGERRGVRVHAAVVVLGGGGGGKNIWPSCSTTCGSSRPEARCSR